MTEQNQAEALDESAWLIEHGASEPWAPRYWGGVHGWTYDHAKAVRFCREVDAQSQAEAMDDGFPNNYRLAEHGWCTRLVREDVRPEDEDAPCPVCGCEARGQGGYLQCECPAPKHAERQQAVAEALAARDAEIERLREALTKTINLAVAYADGTGTIFIDGIATARAALQETKP